MKILKVGAAHYAVGLFAVAAIVAGCTSGSQTALGPNQPNQPGAMQSHRISPLQTVSTRVRINNFASFTIYGSGSAMCWSISPTPLPSVAPSGNSAPITLTYDEACVTPSSLGITYGPLTTPQSCKFITSFGSSGFSYTVDNSVHTACTATPSTSALVNEYFNYKTASSTSRRATRTPLHI